VSLEDTPPVPPSALEMGDKVFTLPPGKANLFMSFKAEDAYFMNHYKDGLYYCVEHVAPNPIHGDRGVIIVHFGPISRRDEFVPR